jgi:hypothetical protein
MNLHHNEQEGRQSATGPRTGVSVIGRGVAAGIFRGAVRSDALRGRSRGDDAAADERAGKSPVTGHFR